MLNQIPKTLEDFEAIKKVGGIHQQTVDTVKNFTKNLKTDQDKAAKRHAETGADQSVSEYVQSIETCDAIMDKLDELGGA